MKGTILSIATILRVSIVLILANISGLATASTVFFGEDINRREEITGSNSTIRIPHLNGDTAHAAFLSHLQSVSTETFESFAPNTNVSTLTFGTETATLSPSRPILSNPPPGNPDTLPDGTSQISGNQFLFQDVDVSSFSLSFSRPQTAFGFYATDIETPGNLTLHFLLADGISTIDRQVPSQAGTGGLNDTGSVLYYGVIDATNPFIGISFSRSYLGDVIGFDDFTIGREIATVPIPSTLWLFSFALAGLGIIGKGQSSRKPA